MLWRHSKEGEDKVRSGIMGRYINSYAGCNWDVYNMSHSLGLPWIARPEDLREATIVLRSPRPMLLLALDLTAEANDLYGMCCYRLAKGWPTYNLGWVGTQRYWVQLDGSAESRLLVDQQYVLVREGRRRHQAAIIRGRAGAPAAGRPLWKKPTPERPAGLALDLACGRWATNVSLSGFSGPGGPAFQQILLWTRGRVTSFGVF